MFHFGDGLISLVYTALTLTLIAQCVTHIACDVVPRGLSIVFIHQNAPGQFQQIGPFLAGEEFRNDVYMVHDSGAPTYKKFMTDELRANGSRITWIRYEKQSDSEAMKNMLYCTRHTTSSIIRGRAVVQRMDEAIERGEMREPDVIIGHVGWGEMLMIRTRFPDIPVITYAEWYYRSQPGYRQQAGFEVLIDFEVPCTRENQTYVSSLSPYEVAESSRVEEQHMQGSLWRACASMIMEKTYQHSDLLWSPTKWQRDQLPAYLRKKTIVAFDGVDTDYFKPKYDFCRETPLPDEAEVLEGMHVTYITRNFEPYRGVHILFPVLKRLAQEYPGVRFTAVGKLDKGYSNAHPTESSWYSACFRNASIPNLEVKFGTDRDGVVNILRSSSVHLYWSIPFVLSWSLVESMSTGAIVVASDTEPVRELITHNHNGLLLPFGDVEHWVRQVGDILLNPHKYRPLRCTARQTVLDGYSRRLNRQSISSMIMRGVERVKFEGTDADH